MKVRPEILRGIRFPQPVVNDATLFCAFLRLMPLLGESVSRLEAESKFIATIERVLARQGEAPAAAVLRSIRCSCASHMRAN